VAAHAGGWRVLVSKLPVKGALAPTRLQPLFDLLLLGAAIYCVGLGFLSVFA